MNNKLLGIVKSLTRKKIDNNQIKILDWGCGEGFLVQALNQEGFDAYGIELKENLKIVSKVLSGTNHYKEKIFFIDINNKTNFLSDYFDIIITNQVFEHVPKKKKLISELHRILKKDGVSYNILPAKFRINEVHFKMPIIHWLPKNYLRKLFIIFFNIFKTNHWNECKKLSFLDQADYYFQYSVNKTFYINSEKLFDMFKNKGFNVIDKSIKKKVFNNFLFRFIKNRFISIEFLAIKK